VSRNPSSVSGGGRGVRGEIAMRKKVLLLFYLRVAGAPILRDATFARGCRPALCPVWGPGVVCAMGRFRSCSFLVWGAGCEGAGRAGGCAAPQARRGALWLGVRCGRRSWQMHTVAVRDRRVCVVYACAPPGTLPVCLVGPEEASQGARAVVVVGDCGLRSSASRTM
jgi:hypothetical protein